MPRRCFQLPPAPCNSLPLFSPAPAVHNPHIMTTCTATTVAGQPCKNHAVKGSLLCKAHGGSALVPGRGLEIRHGAPLGNTNALKHGFYRPTIRQDEYADLITNAEQFDLADELAITRVRLRRLMTYREIC